MNDDIKFTLRKDQSNAVRSLRQFMADGEDRVIAVTGNRGSGKTTAVDHFLLLTQMRVELKLGVKRFCGGSQTAVREILRGYGAECGRITLASNCIIIDEFVTRVDYDVIGASRMMSNSGVKWVLVYEYSTVYREPTFHREAYIGDNDNDD